MSRLKQISIMQARFHLPEEEGSDWIGDAHSIIAIMPPPDQDSPLRHPVHATQPE